MLKKVINRITTVYLIIVVIVSILLVGVRLVGIEPFTVLSGSMEPTYHVGSIIYVVDVKPEELKNNDCVTYVIEGGTVVTHRIVDVVPDEDNPSIVRFRTKGDANDIEDGTLLSPLNVLGKPIFTIPYLGYVASVVQKPQGIVLIVGICVMLLLISYISDAIASLKKEEE